MEIHDVVICKSGDKKGEEGRILAVDKIKNRVHVKWPRGYSNTWMKIENLIKK